MNLKKLLFIGLTVFIIFGQFTSLNAQAFDGSSNGDGDTYHIVNDNVPYFTDDQLTETDSYIYLSDLDEYGRVGVAEAILNVDTFPASDREDISGVAPTGWNQNTQGDEISEVVSGSWLYNRSHLLGHQMTGLNDDERNLMTGTEWFNQTAMVPIENFVANYIEEEESPVLYRVTPYFEGEDLLAQGVFMEAYSLDDNGESIQFNIFVKNVQQDVSLNYSDGTYSLSPGQINDVNIPAHPFSETNNNIEAQETNTSETNMIDDLLNDPLIITIGGVILIAIGSIIFNSIKRKLK